MLDSSLLSGKADMSDTHETNSYISDPHLQRPGWLHRCFEAVVALASQLYCRIRFVAAAREIE